jgi:hypothetical protein
MEKANKKPIYFRRWTIAGMIVFVLALMAFGAINFISGCTDKPVQADSTSTGIQPDYPTAFSDGGGSASYPTAFNNFAELCAASDIVALGEVERVIEVLPQHGSLFFTRFSFRIEKVFKGDSNAEVTLSITGNPESPGSNLEEDPLFSVGERYLLFLHEFDDGLYYSLGPWGRFQIVDNRVYSINRIVNINWYKFPDLDFNGISEKDFLTRLTGVLDEVHLLVLDKNKQPDTTLRFMATKTQILYPTLSTGRHGPGQVVYSVVRVEDDGSDRELPLPDGMEVSIEPGDFRGEPRHEYRSTMTIYTSHDFQWGTYWLVVRCMYGNIVVKGWQLMVNVNPAGGEITMSGVMGVPET